MCTIDMCKRYDDWCERVEFNLENLAVCVLISLGSGKWRGPSFAIRRQLQGLPKIGKPADLTLLGRIAAPNLVPPPFLRDCW